MLRAEQGTEGAAGLDAGATREYEKLEDHRPPQ
jgi:hypothetical protein